MHVAEVSPATCIRIRWEKNAGVGDASYTAVYSPLHMQQHTAQRQMVVRLNIPALSQQPWYLLTSEVHQPSDMIWSQFSHRGHCLQGDAVALAVEARSCPRTRRECVLRLHGHSPRRNNNGPPHANPVCVPQYRRPQQGGRPEAYRLPQALASRLGDREHRVPGYNGDKPSPSRPP
jgi:hypothetical protein